MTHGFEIHYGRFFKKTEGNASVWHDWKGTETHTTDHLKPKREIR